MAFISKQLIKPSSPTPHHLRNYRQSSLDLITPPVYNSMVYFFSTTSSELSHDSNHNLTTNLKKSLSDILTHYYPLAGRFTPDGTVDCNDEGVPFVEARVRCPLSEFISEIEDQSALNKLLPFDVNNLADMPLCVQLTFFDCGGIALCPAISHQLCDALSYFTFVNAWAKLAQSLLIDGEANNNVIKTQFVSSELFPPQDDSMGSSSFDPKIYLSKDKVLLKRFVFDKNSVEVLKSKISAASAITPSSEKQKPLSRMEALSAFIWSRFVAVTEETSESAHDQVQFGVNLRPRMEPALPDYSFGNYSVLAVSSFKVQYGENSLGTFIKQVRGGINRIDKKYVEKLQQSQDMSNEFQEVSVGEIRRFFFTSLCWFPLYDADFGWGKAMWAGPPVRRFANSVVFMDTRDGDGIEAYVSLLPHDMAKLENDEEFRAYAATASPFQPPK